WYGTSTDIDDRKRAEETLREQADLLNLTHDAIFVMTMEGVIKYWNRGAEEQYGWAAKRAVGKDVHDLLKTVFPAPLEQIKAEVVRTGRWEGELVHTKKDETQIVVASRWSLQRGEQGAPIAILETNNDITDRKRAEEALRRSNRELRAISNCNQTLLRATDEQSLLEEICRIVCEEAGYRVAWVAYAEHDEAKSVRLAAWTGTEEGYLANLGITWADTQHGWGPTGTAIRSGKSCCIQDFATDTRMATWRESAVLRDFRSGIALPLKDECGDAFGSLTIYSEQPNAFNSEEIRLLEELASDLAFGIVTLRSRAARQRAEETLREGETRFRTFVDHAADALFIYDFEQGTIVDVNRQACESLGYTRQELIGTTAVAFHLESDRAQMESLAERAAAGETVIDTHWHRRKDGTLFPVEVHTSQYWYGGRRFLLKVARDITDRKRAEEALRRSEAYLAEGQRLSHTGSFAWSAATLQSIYWSEEMFRIFGLNPQEGVPSAEAFWQRIHPEDLDRARELLLKAAGGNMHYEHDHRILLPDGTVKHIHAIGHPVLGENGQVADYVGTAVDVTDRKRAEEERERLRQLEADLAHINRVGMMGELAASIAHEVNQPLSGVVVNANACLRWLAGDSPNLDEAREAVRRIV
ncbi:MAG: PAS domain S-box protein, partial [Bryobacteraceae bacterium]